MDRTWRRLRTLSTVTMVFIGALLLAAAWLSLGKFHAEVAVDFAFIGLILAPGFYAIFTLVGWQRSAGNGAEPGRFIAWCVRHKLGPVSAFGFMFLLLGLMQNVTKAMDRPFSPQGVGDFSLADFRNGCVASGVKEIRAAGGDLTVARPRLESSCGCLARKFDAGYSDTEKEAWAANPDRLRDAKFSRLVQICVGQG